MARSTLVLLHYRRPENMKRVLAAVREQTEKLDLIVCDNSPRQPRWPRRARVIRAPWNAGTFARIWAAFYADTEYVIFMDDDLLPSDRRVFEDAVDLACERPQYLTGIFGAEVRSTPPYYYADAHGNVQVVKGRFTVFNRACLERVRVGAFPMRWTPHYRNRVDDLFLSLELGEFGRFHWADPALSRRFRFLDEGPHALAAHPDHVRIRDEFVRDYLASMPDWDRED